MNRVVQVLTSRAFSLFRFASVVAWSSDFFCC